ncbi:ribonuclease III [Candidatus Woesebacteria bacterium RIFOXYC1_FULL_31_51]|uniref:Ribonuclease 3 n=1 Tax=Candidatus Woesebacteria bacterium GW2011_GWC2_31_9 TaxID=1618586 RepID=A0A0G0BII8_9BACT|nr:MAG: rnc, ribonuclease 3 [Candidatus Woesebacteria bacterium GW2011_GWF1_31_35]KKP22701.1 MAG: Ribonuclease 3 [Candidatus Woesebacteria bacterium GW2011_GWC1_30_29]KKP25916.1 MAG: Ribonuclease 3 [Candidatus Woesebacteria bacterium GW2011_GWD1_31_12]KKP27143.1 MAG: Ribonuclease 3 [Candidatus Woesebacteria bacterium GW2011_GWB1_31_29]KKP30862.1 MAG: Ribonuclease 3 [Candidatus Woesebacteria bacterium GW2011_GWC2_31_9]KKP33506.1 MAG: Ribonuclease 3 [Candidatus Woesebacteria bacterium GW2011_GWF
MTDPITLKTIFKNENLYLQALTHRSWVNENIGVRGTNERLEFLGDAILEFVVSKELFIKFPEKEEGYLTALRANLVNTKNLSELAGKIGLGSEIFLSKGEEEGGGRNNSSLLADTVEAIIGALFMDQGISTAEEFIKENILIDVNKKINSPLKDPKSLLQEKVQSNKLPAPKYQVITEEGPDHNKNFTIEVIINGKPIAKGTGKNKSEAEQNAAEKALLEIK